jgi:hypothetical protein
VGTFVNIKSYRAGIAPLCASRTYGFLLSSYRDAEGVVPYILLVTLALHGGRAYLPDGLAALPSEAGVAAGAGATGIAGAFSTAFGGV